MELKESLGMLAQLQGMTQQGQQGRGGFGVADILRMAQEARSGREGRALLQQKGQQSMAEARLQYGPAYGRLAMEQEQFPQEQALKREQLAGAAKNQKDPDREFFVKVLDTMVRAGLEPEEALKQTMMALDSFEERKRGVPRAASGASGISVGRLGLSIYGGGLSEGQVGGGLPVKPRKPAPVAPQRGTERLRPLAGYLRSIFGEAGLGR